MDHKVFGLVMAGGKSTRMGTPKGLLNYHGKPQMFHIYELLQKLCNQVFISCKNQQIGQISTGYNFLPDDKKYDAIGPMAGLLTATSVYPNTSFIVIGCDYPYLDNQIIELLAKQLLELKKSVSIYNNLEKIREPLLSGYHCSELIYLNSYFKTKKYSLRQFLDLIDATPIYIDDEKIYQSVDDPESYRDCLHFLKRDL